MMAVGILFIILTIAGGVDYTRIITSPTRLLGRLGNKFTSLLSRSKMTGGGTLNSLGRMAGNIAVIQMMGILPFPYNVLLFFVYYKFMTGILFCLIPTLLAIWSVTQIHACRKEVIRRENEYRTLEDNEIVERLTGPPSRTGKEERKPLVTTTATNAVVVRDPEGKNQPPYNPNYVPMVQPVHRHVDYRSSELYPHV